MKLCSIILCCLAFSHLLPAQNRFSGEFLPKLILSGEFNQRLSWTTALDGEATWLSKEGEMPSEFSFFFTDLNLQLGLDYQWTTNLNLAAGYQFGFEDLNRSAIDLEHRLLQQISAVWRPGKVRLQGRLRTEQRFFKNNNYRIEHRLRSRLSADLPLQGQQLDPGEIYLNTNSEWLFPLSVDRPLLFSEIRNYLGLGWRLSNGHRLENGLEWRTRALNNDGNRRHNFFWRVTWIL